MSNKRSDTILSEWGMDWPETTQTECGWEGSRYQWNGAIINLNGQSPEDYATTIFYTENVGGGGQGDKDCCKLVNIGSGAVTTDGECLVTFAYVPESSFYVKINYIDNNGNEKYTFVKVNNKSFSFVSNTGGDIKEIKAIYLMSSPMEDDGSSHYSDDTYRYVVTLSTIVTPSPTGKTNNAGTIFVDSDTNEAVLEFKNEVTSTIYVQFEYTDMNGEKQYSIVQLNPGEKKVVTNTGGNIYSITMVAMSSSPNGPWTPTLEDDKSKYTITITPRKRVPAGYYFVYRSSGDVETLTDQAILALAQDNQMNIVDYYADDVKFVFNCDIINSKDFIYSSVLDGTYDNLYAYDLVVLLNENLKEVYDALDMSDIKSWTNTNRKLYYKGEEYTIWYRRDIASQRKYVRDGEGNTDPVDYNYDFELKK